MQPVQAQPQAQPPEDGETLPKRFGKYTLLRRLALGGMAELFLALQRSVAGFEKLVVVKRVLPELASDEAFVAMLLQEARIAATLTHPNIAQVYDVGHAEGRYFIAMEHVHGEDLRSIVRQMKKKEVRSFPLEHTIAIVLGCCKGLAYAHDQRDLDGNELGIVHRDVSPQNVLVTFTGDVKLVDFGIAKAATGAEEKPGKLKGKVPYMSPEQAQGLELDRRSDIFSLGVMLFELTTGKRLFRGDSDPETLRTIVEGNYPTPRSLNPNIPERLEQIILRSLEPSRERRYPTAHDMQVDLEAFIRDTQMPVSPLSLGEWMRTLFDDKLAQQKQMLQEGRQLAEVLAAQASDELTMGGASLSGVSIVRERENKTPWVLLGVVLLVAALAAVGTWLLWPKAPTGPGVLALTSEPPGAAIWIDGARREERTPAVISSLPVGTYEVKLTAEGFVPFVQTVELTTQTPQVEISGALERPTADAYGVVRVTTSPLGAQVLFDGRAVEGATPLTIPEIQPGTEHTLAITLDGYQTVTQTLLLRAGQVEDVNVTLERTPLGPDEALLVVITDPTSARLVHQGRTYETGSPYELRLPAGRANFRVAKTGFDSAEREVALRGGTTTEITVTLERERVATSSMGAAMNPTPVSGPPGTLTFDARPWCNVSIDGQNVGQTPIVNRSIPAGSHRITCVNPELGVTRTISVDVEPGQPTRRRIDLQ